MTLIVFCAVPYQALAVDETEEEQRVRPKELVEVPEGMILRPREEQGPRTVFRPKQEYKCFTAEEWGTVGHLITDYRWLWHYSGRMEMKIALFQKEIGNLELQLTIQKDNEAIVRRGFESMTGLLDKEHQARLRINKNKRLELWAWRVGTIVGLVATGVFGAAWGVERTR